MEGNMAEYKQIGSRLRALRESRGDSQEDIGKVLGVKGATISRYETGSLQITLLDLQKIADHYGVSINYFLGRESNNDQIATELRRATEALEETRKHLEEVVPFVGEWVWLPLIGTVPAGYPEWQEEHEAEEFYPCSVEQIKKRDGSFALRVKGDSMIERRLLDGDIIFVDAKRQPKPGDVVVARKDEEVVLRIYKEDAKGPYLEAGNKGYPLLRLKDARVLGVVVGSYRAKP